MSTTDITDATRREMAKRLRHIAHQPPEWATTACIIAETFDDDYPLWRDSGPLFDMLADLIDRPTCTPEVGLEMRVCSECDVECIDGLANYCPNCGAEVVDDDDYS